MTCLDNEACSQPTHQEPGGGGGDLGLLSPPQPRPRPLHPPDLHLPRHHRSLRRPLGAPPLRARGDDRHRQRGESMIILEIGGVTINWFYGLLSIFRVKPIF